MKTPAYPEKASGQTGVLVNEPGSSAEVDFGRIFLIPFADFLRRTAENFRDPARAIFSGASSNRDVAIADGDITVAGLARR